MTFQATTPEALLERLVGFDTTSRNSNLELIHFVRDYLGEHGVEAALIHDEGANKANLFATLGPARDGGVVLSGHTDVVPVDGQDWSSEPFRVVERQGRLYGRGTADMKSFIAVALALVPEFLAAELKWPIHLAFSYDEEIGCLGVHGIIGHIAGLSTRPRAVIIGEPTEMKVVNAHKGATSVDTTVRGLEAHSSATRDGVNAVEFGAEYVHHLNAIARRKREEGPFDERFEPPYTTIAVGTFQGGTARNIIAAEARIGWGIRTIPGDDDLAVVEEMRRFAETELLAEMRRHHAHAEILTEIGNRVAGLVAEEGSDAETLVLALTGSNRTWAVSYGTEGGIFQAAGIPTVICGPGSIGQAHKPDEFIETSEVRACVDFMRKLYRRLAED
jgi:acetylornithine deacetylase